MEASPASRPRLRMFPVVIMAATRSCASWARFLLGSWTRPRRTGSLGSSPGAPASGGAVPSKCVRSFRRTHT
uniref:APOBEC3A transcript variant 3 n=1 Tax=Macaca fascicularis TaxID=9541 RepID=A0A0K0MIN8_MACFA|nr:APOBEC3A transcript variant 3 [Macaca fascicularis]